MHTSDDWIELFACLASVFVLLRVARAVVDHRGRPASFAVAALVTLAIFWFVAAFGPTNDGAGIATATRPDW